MFSRSSSVFLAFSLLACFTLLACSESGPSTTVDAGPTADVATVTDSAPPIDAKDDDNTITRDSGTEAAVPQTLVATYVFHGGSPQTLTMTYDKNLVYPGVNEIYSSTGTASNGANTALLQVTVNTTQPASPVIDAKMNFPFMQNGYYVLRCIDGKPMMECTDAQFKVDRATKTIEFLNVTLVGENLVMGQLTYDLEQVVTFSGRIQYAP